MKMSYAGLWVLAVSLCAGNGWADGRGSGRGSERSSRHDSGYHSHSHHEERYERSHARVIHPACYPAPRYRPRGEMVRMACPPRRVWQPGCWVMQDLGCGRYQQVWRPGRYIAISSPGFTYVSSW